MADRLSPSSSDKWMVCTDWLNATRGLPNVSSVYAAEGTEAHKVLELCLRLKVGPREVTDDENMIDAVASALSWIEDYVEQTGAEIYPETPVNWSDRTEVGTGGTSDLVLVSPDELVVADYKHGRGVIVDPTQSSQLRLYLAGAIKKFGRRPSYKVVILQPRASGFQAVRSVDVTEQELAIFLEKAHHATEKNLSGTGERNAGDHCRFCTAAALCPALAERALRAAVQEFEAAGDALGTGADLGL